MTRVSAGARRIVAAMALLILAAAAAPLAAQQTGVVDPNADAVKEQQLLQQFNRIQGLGTIPDTRSYVIEQPMGRKWRQYRQVILPLIGTIAMLGMILLLLVFFLVRGRLRIRSGRSGVNVVRFNAFERFVHWMTATCFILMALTGLNITFGRGALLPHIGPDAFSRWSLIAKYVHNFLSFPFTLGVFIIFLMWLAGNIPNRTDIEWLTRGGGFGNDDPPAYRFNAGQKMIYWIVVLAGATVAVTGYLLMFPFFVTGIFGMQIAQMVHGTVAVLFIAVMIAHVYIGTIGEEGAFEAMGEGTVDLNWAKQHHPLWLDEEPARSGPDQIPRQPAATPAE
ncbi:MAG TPA: formate dehydrogenase subunit gamma [Xanthobacteraceae bacterium]|jgi:formate dehydrogenase subunit gamma